MHILAGTGELPCSAAEPLPAQSPWAGQLKSMVSEGLLVPQGQPAGCELGAGCLGGSTFISPGFVPNVKKLLGGTHHAKFGLRSDSSSARDYRLVDSRRAAEGEAGKGLVETMEEKRVRLECLAPPYSPGKCGYQCVIFSRRGSYFVESVDRKNRTSQRHPPARTLLSSTTLPAQCITPWLM